MNDLQIQLDRLVDGELSSAEYPALLASFDKQPAHWRSCALAFLESQALQSGCRRLASIDLEHSLALPVVVGTAPEMKSGLATTLKRNRLVFRPLSQFGALAAALLLTFFLGRGSVPSSVQSSPGDPQLADMNHDEMGAAPAMKSHVPTAMSRGRLSLVVDDAQGTPQQLEVPVLDGNRFDSRQLLIQPQLSSEISAALRSRGRNVESHREVYPLDRGDGTHLLVPIDRIRVVPSTRPAF